ncbi:F-box/LRR-repeat protein At5g63520-like isoform X1 [Herrania umbratica]|uniref:F-box/LRR-repeat protein At5g63520-like isoform X1 n=1 Tax=Herrania umbratica TaxID=108875 RepID=A0A6J1AHZ0_9ROSI|nr:F-box/LRR-repeat protein At5g63520-like isoform X1 [Herrania umbratica]
MGCLAAVNDDILQNILSRLPALSFAWAACVSKSWNKVCDRVLSRPKLVSALSLNPSLPDAVKEVLEKVLSSPIRPQFAIASIGLQFSLEEAHQLITEKLGSRTPVITNATFGIIGRDALTNTMKEVRWNFDPEEDNSNSQGSDAASNFNRGIVLIVGFLPGLKVDTIPLLRPKREPRFTMIDKFMMDIRDYTASVSGCIAPAGIILFGDQHTDMTPVLAEIDCAMPEETVIVGDASSRFLFRSGGNSQSSITDLYYFDAVALVFAGDKDKPHGIGETRFHVTLSTGVMPFGPELRAVSVTSKGSECSWLTACMNGYDEILDSQRLLDDISDEMDDESTDLYIGVIQKRPSSIEPEKLELRTYLAFYEVLGGDEEYLVVDGVGIRPGDTFLFYHSDSDTASSSCLNAFENLKVLKAASSSKTRYSIRDVAAAGGGGDGNGEVFGCLMFSCHYRGESYFDSFPFYSNFPGAPLAGVVCNKEIGRDSTGSSTSMWQQAKGESPARCSLHVCTTVYLVLSFVPPSPDH